MNNILRTSALALVLLLVPFLAGAATFQTGENPNLPAGEELADDMYVFGGNITNASSIVGDLVTGGGNIFVNGSVAEDLMAGGGTVIISADVADDVRVGGGNVVLQGAVGDDALIGGGQVNILGPGIGGDLVVAGGVVTLSAPVGGDVRIGGGEVVIDASVAGNVEIDADRVTIGANAAIEGNLSYRAKKEAAIAEGAFIGGETLYEPRKSGTDRGDFAAGLAVIFSALFLLKMLAFFVSALVVGLVFRRFAASLVGHVAKQPLRELGRGLIFAIVTPVVAVALVVTILGMPLGFLAFALFAAAMILATIMAIVVVGAVVHGWIRKPDTPQVNWKTILLGAVIYALLSLVPFIGWIIQCGIVLLSLGALIRIGGEVISNWR